ncbi:aminoglycoside phosphotransferase [Nonomuraea aridisoli]|uniref:Aminoglycoside phosphotransferase n=1 Tax=Nonomuraea aridisoli TaxID=2070368 RepID=A0A2W2D9Z7_9ACTN|nr:aminoglycoside phosphotransferase [Nonomuraea aridisoli]PZG08806.1 aminoglycoside phosphotransferase [Nonomuraea aridisoli]
MEDEIAAVLGGPDAVMEPLTHNPANAVTGGIWRVRRGSRSAVLKVLTRRKEAPAGWEHSDDPRHWNYWRREAEVYADGLPGVWAAAGIRAPRLLRLVERDDGDLALWTEDVTGLPGARWDVGRHALLGHRLGLAQGVAGQVDRRYLSRSFLRDYLESKRVPYELLEDDAAWRQPVVAEHFPPGLRGELIRLHRDREWFLTILESLPRALCHLDLWPSNVFDDGGGSVLVDWTFAGDGALGEDVGNHIPDSVFDLFLPAARLPELDAAVYGGYVRGLREAGLRGDERLVRLAVCASAVKYDFLAPLMLLHAGRAQLDYGGTRPVDVARRYRERGAALRYLAGWADEARRLADAVW